MLLKFWRSNNCRAFWMVLVFSNVLGCASADRGQAADGLTTWYALQHGFSESNPVLKGLEGPEIFAVKMVVTQGVKFLPMEYCHPGLVVLTASGFGLALWNIATMVGNGLVGIPFAVALLIWRWDDWNQDAVATCANPFYFPFVDDVGG